MSVLSSKFSSVTEAMKFSASLGPCLVHKVRATSRGAVLSWQPLRLMVVTVPPQEDKAPSWCARVTQGNKYLVMRELDNFYVIRDNLGKVRKVNRHTLVVERMRSELSPVFEVC